MRIQYEDLENLKYLLRQGKQSCSVSSFTQSCWPSTLIDHWIRPASASFCYKIIFPEHIMSRQLLCQHDFLANHFNTLLQKINIGLYGVRLIVWFGKIRIIQGLSHSVMFYFGFGFQLKRIQIHRKVSHILSL